MDTVVLKITNLLFIYNSMQISLMYEFSEKIKIKHVLLLCMYFNHDNHSKNCQKSLCSKIYTRVSILGLGF